MLLRLPRYRARNSFRRFSRRHEQSERAVRKRRESEVAVESSRPFIRRFDHDGENGERTGGPSDPTNRVSQQKISDTFTVNFLITREPPDQSSRDRVVARQAFCMFWRQIGDGEREGTQAVESNDPALIVHGDKNTGHIALLVLPITKVEPTVERDHTTRERRAVMLAERSIALIMHDQPKRRR